MRLLNYSYKYIYKTKNGKTNSVRSSLKLELADHQEYTVKTQLLQTHQFRSKVSNILMFVILDTPYFLRNKKNCIKSFKLEPKEPRHIIKSIKICNYQDWTCPSHLLPSQLLLV